MIKDHEVVPVRLRGRALFWLRNEDGSGALAPREHLSDDGHVRIECMFEDSYAHVFADGTIMRYRAPIGRVEDLERVAAPGDMRL